MPRLTPRRPSPATAIALIGLFFALGGASMAASAGQAAVRLITGKQIKDGSIAAKDLSRGARRALTGRIGPPGQPGPAGPQGLRGASLVWRGAWSATRPYRPLDVVSHAGSAYIAGAAAAAGQVPTDASPVWDLLVAKGAVGPQGVAGVFDGQFKSPNDQFSIAVADTGIVLDGPGGKITVDAGKVELTSPVKTAIQGTLVSLGGAGGCKPVARTGDMTDFQSAQFHSHAVGQGSTTVLAC